MVNSKEEDFVVDRKIEGSEDRETQAADEIFEDSSVGVSSREMDMSEVGSTRPSRVPQGSRISAGTDGGLTGRLRNILSDEGLLLQQTDRENNVFQWLQALDLQVVGACRADERLKPLLKLNVSRGAAEDRLLAHLSQHFEASEVGMLARCLCIPLVSIRVGKVIKQGTLLCPTAARGNLTLALLPSSDLRITFAGDDGCTERLATLSSNSECSAVVIEEIAADDSGRSFLVKLPGGQKSYFWCSEKLKLLGAELLAKMKDLLRRKPSLAQLTGISESRLDCFAIHLRGYLLGSTVSNAQANPTVSSTSLLDTASDSFELDSNTQVSSLSSNPSCPRHNSGRAAKAHLLCQGSISRRSNSLKDDLLRNFSSIKSGVRENCRRRRDSHCCLSAADCLPAASTSTVEVARTSRTETSKLPEVGESCHLSSLSFLESLGKSVIPPSSNPLSLRLPSSQVPATGSSLFSPYYCWCPPCTSTLQYTVTPPHLPISSTESLSLPSLSSLLSAARSSSSLAPTKPPLSLVDVPSLDFPAFLPEPMIRVSLPVSSFIAVPSSQQIPMFTPLMCDPIVHIPVIGVCSSGQGYLVSAGPAISTTISPLHPNFVNPLIPETESIVEKGARETLRLLLSSTQTNPQLMEVLPAVLTSTDKKHSMLVVGSRGLYTGTQDVDAIANSIVAMGMASQPSRAVGGDVTKRHGSNGDLENQSEESGGWDGSCSDDGVEDSASSSHAVREGGSDVD